MKVVLLNVLILMVSNTGFAADYVCRGAVGEPVVEVVDVDGHPQFRYLVDGETQLSLNMNEGSVQPVTRLPIGFEAGQTFTFRPGDDRIHIYGRILSRGAVFDIFTLGMQATLVDYECRVQA